MNVLVVNAGSTSLKYAVYDGERRVCDGEATSDAEIAVHLGSRADTLGAVGHRVVHGGAKLTAALRIDDAVEAAIEACAEFAPLHNPVNLRGIRAARARWPQLLHVAVFDTAFHATLPPHAYRYAIADELYATHGVRRFGFHGPSHQHMTDAAASVLGGHARLVTCHLGGGSSVSAIAGGRSVDTSMGMTPLAGVPMVTRCGDLDPAVPGFLMQRGMSREAVDDVLEHHSGLAGVSGLGSDVRAIEAAAARGEDRARLALDLFVHGIRKYIGAYVAVLGGADALVFTAGIGEHSATIRAEICATLGGLGIAIDAVKNRDVAPSPDGEAAEISGPGARVRVFVVHAQEERVIAREVRGVLASEADKAQRGSGAASR